MTCPHPLETPTPEAKKSYFEAECWKCGKRQDPHLLFSWWCAECCEGPRRHSLGSVESSERFMEDLKEIIRDAQAGRPKRTEDERIAARLGIKL